jgi:ribosomal protein S18 acetylase RimI-like enzyme
MAMMRMAMRKTKFAEADKIALHVQISNVEAIGFHITRFGFEKGDMVENYYRQIDPPHCYLLYKKLR